MFLLTSQVMVQGNNPVTSGDDLEKELKRLDDFMSRVDRIEGLIDRSAFDVEALRQKLGHDPEKIFDFVRDRIGYQAYKGVLRGAQGTLLEGRGNSLDQTLLLLHLLQIEKTPLKYRFVSGTLSSDKAKALVDSMSRETVEAEVTEEESIQWQEDLRDLGISAQEYARIEQEFEADVEEFLVDIQKNVMKDHKLISEKLKEKNIDVPQSEDDTYGKIIEAAQDHFWLQIKEGDKWVDLDPCFPQARIGEKFCSQEEVMEKLDDGLFHRLSLEISLEQLVAEKTQIHALYRNSKPLSQLNGHDISVTIVPEGMDIDSLVKTADSAQAQDRIEAFRRYQPIIEFGPTREFGSPFDLEGNHYIYRDGSFQGAQEEGVQALGRRIFDRRKKENHLSALWLEIGLISPGQEETRFRRDLIDRIGPENRKSKKMALSEEWKNPKRVKLALIHTYCLLPVCSRFSHDYVLSKSFEVVFEKRELLRYHLRLEHGDSELSFAEISDSLDFFPSHLLALAQSSWVLLGDTVPKNASYYYTRPNLYAYEESLDLDGSSQIIHRSGYDIVSNSIQLAAPEGKKANQNLGQFIQGLLLSNLELEMSQSFDDGAAPWSTHTVMENALEQDIDILVLTPEEEAQLEDLAINARAKSLLHKELTSGYIVILPERDVVLAGAPPGDKNFVAWWRVDPKTSNVIGVTEYGRNQTHSERVMLVEKFSMSASKNCMKYVACLLQGIFGGGPLYQTNARCLWTFLKGTLKNSLNIVRSKYYETMLGMMRGRPLGSKVKKLLSIGWKINDSFLH